MRKTTMVALAALVGGAPVAAQQQEGAGHMMPMPREGMPAMQQCMAMMGGPPPQMLLQHRDALGLTAEQASRLEALQKRLQDTAMPHMPAAMEAHAAAAELLKGDAPDWPGYEARLREAADRMVQGHVAMARVTVDARRVLTQEQQQKLDDLRARMMGGQHGMMGGNRQGMMSQGQGGMGAHAMGGMDCMMMDMTAQGRPPLR